MPNTPEVLERIGSIAVSIERLAAQYEHLDQRYELLATQARDANAHTQTKIEKVVTMLNGDGGLIVRIHRLEDRAERLDQLAKAADDWRRWATRLVLGAAILALLSAVGFAITSTFKPVPQTTPATQLGR